MVVEILGQVDLLLRLVRYYCIFVRHSHYICLLSHQLCIFHQRQQLSAEEYPMQFPGISSQNKMTKERYLNVIFFISEKKQMIVTAELMKQNATVTYWETRVISSP